MQFARRFHWGRIRVDSNRAKLARLRGNRGWSDGAFECDSPSNSFRWSTRIAQAGDRDCRISRRAVAGARHDAAVSRSSASPSSTGFLRCRNGMPWKPRKHVEKCNTRSGQAPRIRGVSYKPTRGLELRTGLRFDRFEPWGPPHNVRNVYYVKYGILAYASVKSSFAGPVTRPIPITRITSWTSQPRYPQSRLPMRPFLFLSLVARNRGTAVTVIGREFTQRFGAPFLQSNSREIHRRLA